MATPCDHNQNILKPASTDNYDVGVFNNNFQEIDNEMYANQQSAAQIMTGASAQADGVSGRVPVPHAGDQTKFLRGDGTWQTAGGGGGGSDVSITPTLSTGRKIAEYEIDGVEGELYAPDPTAPTRRYLGQLCPRVSGTDSHITSSGKTTYSGGENWHAFDGVENASGIANCWAADENNTDAYIQYHFDGARYFTQIILKLYSHYSGAWTGDLKVLGSNDGVAWTNILATGTAASVTAPLTTMNTETIDLDDTGTWEYIRVQADGQAFNVANQPSCDFSEIYVYGGDEIAGIDASLIDFTTLTAAQILYLKDVLGV